jgi:O-antigen/teichoic acid export membrane protein
MGAGGTRERLILFLGRARGESVVVSVARLFSAGCALLIAVVSARHLGPVGRGEIVFVMTVCVLGSEFVSLGVNVSGRIHILRRTGVAVEDCLGLTVVLAVVQALLMVLVLGVVGVVTMGISALSCVLGVFLGVAMFVAHMLVDAAFSLRRTLETGLRDLMIGVTPLLPVLAFSVTGGLSVSLVIGATAAGYAVGGVYLWTVVRRRIGSVRFSPSSWGAIIRSGLPVLGGSFGQALAFRADRLVLGLLATPAALGVFSVAATTAELPRLLLVPVTQVLANRVAGGEIPASGLRRMVVRLGVGYGMVMLVVALFSAQVVLPIVGEEFAGLRDSVAVLALSEMLLAGYFLAVAVLTGLGRFRRLPIPAIVGATVLLVVDVLVVGEHGGLGAAWTRVAGFGMMSIVAVTSMLVVLRSER